MIFSFLVVPVNSSSNDTIRSFSMGGSWFFLRVNDDTSSKDDDL